MSRDKSIPGAPDEIGASIDPIAELGDWLRRFDAGLDVERPEQLIRAVIEQARGGTATPGGSGHVAPVQLNAEGCATPTRSGASQSERA